MSDNIETLTVTELQKNVLTQQEQIKELQNLVLIQQDQIKELNELTDKLDNRVALLLNYINKNCSLIHSVSKKQIEFEDTSYDFDD